MTNLEKYKGVFVEALEIPVSDLENLNMKNCEKWDSIGQMSLIAVLEDTFGFEMTPEEIMDFTSFESGKKILKGRNIEI